MVIRLEYVLSVLGLRHFARQNVRPNTFYRGKMCSRGVISFDKRILFDSCEVRACVTLSKRHKNIRADNTRVSVKSPYFGMNAFAFALA